MKLIPNLHFTGQCEQAIALYQRAFSAEVRVLLHYADANKEDGLYGPEYTQLVYHCELYMNHERMVMSDGLVPDAPPGNTVSILVSMDSVAEAKTAYDTLLDGGSLINAATETTYSTFIASVIDRYGVRWELICEK